jgi:predicted Na+-dependent transporter
MVEQIHFVVLVPHLVGQAACPCLDGVELTCRLVVSRLAYVDLCSLSNVAWTSLEVPRVEHDEALAFDFINAVVPVTASLDNFVL